ncbi:N-acetylglucosaminyl-phosphatidylinositol de-N-acetylase-like [Antedon mediterranea]|uniref:N-acetylglucosaminyl-phosphatidylinositol de-N-acetylase-like n=1 Tax=Antedon mediterranea TaxID=105859 RepID=UPI003AF6A693
MYVFWTNYQPLNWSEGSMPFAVFVVRNLPDSPEIDWDPVVIAKYVEQQVSAHSINRIVTFDAYGVSGHRNHVSVFQAIQMLQRNSKKFKTEIEVLVLKSESCFMKYLSIFSLPFILICHLYTSSYLFLSSPLQVLRTQRAMVKHWSQLLWFRVLHILFSQYMFINNVHVLEE